MYKSPLWGQGRFPDTLNLACFQKCQCSYPSMNVPSYHLLHCPSNFFHEIGMVEIIKQTTNAANNSMGTSHPDLTSALIVANSNSPQPTTNSIDVKMEEKENMLFNTPHHPSPALSMSSTFSILENLFINYSGPTNDNFKKLDIPIMTVDPCSTIQDNELD
jgi:hypothetical protein